MLKELLIVVLHWVDPTVHVVPVAQVQACVPIESNEEIARIDRAMKKNMDGLGKPAPGAIVDPWGTLSSSQREALERAGAR